MGAKVKKVYDEAQTPYQRLLTTGMLEEAKRRSLERLYQSINPVKLRAEIYAAQNSLWQTIDRGSTRRPSDEPSEEPEDLVEYVSATCS